MIVGLDLWQIIEKIEAQKGDKDFSGLSQFGMECKLERYLQGSFSKEADVFYDNNRLYFNLYYKRAEDLKIAYDRFNQERNSRKKW